MNEKRDSGRSRRDAEYSVHEQRAGSISNVGGDQYNLNPDLSSLLDPTRQIPRWALALVLVSFLVAMAGFGVFMVSLVLSGDGGPGPLVPVGFITFMAGVVSAITFGAAGTLARLMGGRDDR